MEGEPRSKKVKEKDLPISASTAIALADRVRARPTFGGFSHVNIGTTSFKSFKKVLKLL